MQQATAVFIETSREEPAHLSAGLSKQLNAAAHVYHREQFLNLSPVEVVKKLYDTAILGCKKNNTTLAQNAITELVVGLNFDYQEISIGLYRLYQYTKHCIRNNNMNEAVRVLEELRATWVKAFRLDQT
ncbi:MAG TPA: flagellar protein FliS [Bacteroidota bacterium]|nr:flagellar protein FliS [Bacteroidota bacterium]